LRTDGSASASPRRRLARRTVSAGAFAAALALPEVSLASDASDGRDAVVHPDLGTIRYHDPVRRRELWLGLDTAGIAIPERVSPLDRRLWLVSLSPAWALSLQPRITIGGRHSVTVYDAENIRLWTHGHMLEASARVMKQRPRLSDRASFGIDMHRVERSVVEGIDFKLGGIQDTIMHFGWGLEHRLAPWLELGWRAHFRHAWVFVDTQRQLRGSVRAAFFPAPRHRVSLELVGFFVNRNPDQAGNPLPKNSVHGQILGEYAWMSRANVGVVAGARYSTSFFSGESPIFEIREESLNADYGEVNVGVRFVWE
jgi:hypothetical protein